MPAASYAEAVQWYYHFASFSPEAARTPDHLKFARVEQILVELGNPHTRFPSVLIAGTKGKGSTAAVLAGILRAAGLRTALFTSPHLHSFRERIRVGDELIAPDDLVRWTVALQAIAPRFPGSTFFEWVTTLAFSYFAEQKVDLAVLEVGLGGRFDTTNVVTPQLAVITPISYDHMDILGHTLTAIASEKAGIIKRGIPVVVAPQPDEANAVIQATAARLHAPLVAVERDGNIEPERITPRAQCIRVRAAGADASETYALPLLGPHQRVNAGTALAAAHALAQLGWPVSPESIRRGLETVSWPARFEILSAEPYVIVDGAHNGASAHELARTLNEVLPGAPVQLIFGASNDKDIPAMLAELAPHTANLILTQAHHPRAASLEQLSEAARPYRTPVQLVPGVPDALALARQLAGARGVVCASGSLFIAAQVRALVLQEQGVRVPSDQ